MSEYILPAFIFGLTAGLQPGPLSIYVIQQTIERGFGYGARASTAPIFTDGPVILLVLFLSSLYKDISAFVGLLSFVGGVYLLYLCLQIVRSKKTNSLKKADASSSFNEALKVNLLNPNVYVFWFAIGGTYITLGTAGEAFAFVVVMLGTLIISKIGVAFLAARFSSALNSQGYLWVMRALGLVLGGFGVSFLIKSVELLS